MVAKTMRKSSEKKTVFAFVTIDKSGHLVSTLYCFDVVDDLIMGLLTPAGPVRSAGDCS